MSFYIQLHHDRIGSLILDNVTNTGCSSIISPWIPPLMTTGFTYHLSKPLSDYIYPILTPLFNDFYRCQENIFDGNDAKAYLQSIFALQGVLMKWNKFKWNHGPLFLCIGDFRPASIVVNDDLDIISIIGGKLSHTTLHPDACSLLLVTKDRTC